LRAKPGSPAPRGLGVRARFRANLVSKKSGGQMPGIGAT
jgi:hypothetical protein